MKFGFYTFGCKVNQFETQAMEQLLADAGHEIVPFSGDCDGYIINTCSVTAVADRKNRTLIRRVRQAHPAATVAVCGCYPQHDQEAVAALGADLIGGSGDRKAFIEALLQAVHDRQKHIHVDQALRRRSFESLPAGALTERTRAMLKVQDGCANFCTYCIIPYTRGPVRSAPLEEAVAQAGVLAQKGFRELVITGIEIASWGRDLPGKPSLASLIAAICRAVPDLRVRLGSLEPRIVTEEFCGILSKAPNLCGHFHLSLQSGSDSVLARMKRKYDTARYLQSVTLLRRYFPDCAITTDMIVAFPGETEAEFAQSLAFMRTCGFADMHIFPYSRRPGTPADKMPGQHSNATKEQRSREAIALAAALRREFLAGMAGKIMDVLFEQTEGGYATGHTENYIKVYVPCCGELHGQVRPVQLEGPYGDGMTGRIL